MTSEIYTKLRSSSPILHVDKISIPVLLLIGKADRRVIPTHGAELYHALKARNGLNGNGKSSVEMLCFDGEGHPLDGVEAAKISFEATVDWFVQATGPWVIS
jgi:acylaminoacyl-peptidase